MPIPVPLYRLDLTDADAARTRAQLACAPFRDAAAVARWEGMWERLWQRGAVAFADHGEAVVRLKEILGWRSGDQWVVDPLLDPAWREAMERAWLHGAIRDVSGTTGQGVGEVVAGAEAGGVIRGEVIRHAFGLPAVLPAELRNGWILEEISGVVRPVPGVGSGGLQMVNLAGPRILPVGMGCVLLSGDEALIVALRVRRVRAPGGAACALGCALLEGLAPRLQRRRALARTCIARLRLAGRAVPPPDPPAGREWEGFHLAMGDPADRTGLHAFLARAGIASGSPLWFAPARPAGVALPGLDHFTRHALALPLYASLTDGDCKRIINRIHRWVERQVG